MLDLSSMVASLSKYSPVLFRQIAVLTTFESRFAIEDGAKKIALVAGVLFEKSTTVGETQIEEILHLKGGKTHFRKAGESCQLGEERAPYP